MRDIVRHLREKHVWPASFFFAENRMTDGEYETAHRREHVVMIQERWLISPKLRHAHETEEEEWDEEEEWL